MFPTLIHKAVVDGFLVAQVGQVMAQGVRAALRLLAHAGRDGCQRWCGGQVVVTHHARHFFDQVFFDLQIETEGWGLHGDSTLAFNDWQAQTTQSIRHALLGQRHANDFFSTRHAQGNRLGHRHVHALVINRAHGRVGRAANVNHQLSDALDVLHSQLRIDTTLKAVARIGAEVEAA